MLTMPLVFSCTFLNVHTSWSSRTATQARNSNCLLCFFLHVLTKKLGPDDRVVDAVGHVRPVRRRAQLVRQKPPALSLDSGSLGPPWECLREHFRTAGVPSDLKGHRPLDYTVPAIGR